MNKIKIITLFYWIVILLAINISLNLVFKNVGHRSSDLNGNLNASLNKKSSLLKLQKDFSSIQNYEEKINGLLPDKNNIINLVKYIEEISKKYSDEYTIHIDDNTNYKNKIEIKPDNIVITIDGKADLAKFITLATILENGPYFIKISEFEIESDESLSSNANYNLKLNVNVDKNF